MTENQRLRALLDEARDAVKHSMNAWTWAGYDDHTATEEALLERIDAVLAEPPAECQTCAVSKAFHDVAIAEKRMAEFHLNEARAEVDRLKKAYVEAKGLWFMAGYNAVNAAEADAWRAKVAEVVKERDEAHAKVSRLLEERNRQAVHFADEHNRTKTAQTERDVARAVAENWKRNYNRAVEERNEARAEVERLKWELEMACENTPTLGCECPGCETARERAEKGEA
jgi:hypothetical protein